MVKGRMNCIAANIVWILHFLFMAWFVLTPFFNNGPMLTLHLFTGPLLWLHWLLNDDTCSLTLLEMKLRGIDHCNESFFWNVVSPIYKPQLNANGSNILWIVSVLLWLITVAKVLRKPEIVGDIVKEFSASFKKKPLPATTP